MPELKAILWDHDGTLVDTEPYWIESQLEMAAEFGYTWTHDDSLACVGTSMDLSAMRIQERGNPLTVEHIIDRQVQRVLALLKERGIPFLPGVKEIFAEIQAAGIRGAVVSNAVGSVVRYDVAGLPAGSIEYVLAWEEMERAKPDPWPYAHAAEVLGVAPEHCLVVEDSPTGTLSAEAAGIVCLAIPSVVDIPDEPWRPRATSLAQVDLAMMRRMVNGEVIKLS